MSFALKNFLGAELKSGADIVMKITGLEEKIRDCNIVITGEGCIDFQTVNGKGPYKVMNVGKRYGKTVFGVSGILGDGYEECLKAGFDLIVPLKDPSMVTGEAVKRLEDTLAELFAGLNA